jgi:LacI family transcriptional regulator
VVTVFGHASNARYAPLIIVDEDVAVLQAVRRLAEFGHRRILFLCGPAGAASSRVPALQSASHSCGVSLMIGLVTERPTADEIEAALRRYALRRSPATAIFVNTMLAPTLLQALDRLQLRVPADMSLVAFGGSAWVQELDLGWATIHSDLQDVGQAAIRIILEWLAGTPPPDITKIASAQWIERASIGPVCERRRLHVVKKAEAAGR